MSQYKEPNQGETVTYKEAPDAQSKLNTAFAIAVICYEILALPIYGVLFRLTNTFTTDQDYGGVLLMSIATILLIVGNCLLIQDSVSLTHMSSDLHSPE